MEYIVHKITVKIVITILLNPFIIKEISKNKILQKANIDFTKSSRVPSKNISFKQEWYINSCFYNKKISIFTTSKNNGKIKINKGWWDLWSM